MAKGKILKTLWCEGGLQLADITNNNARAGELNNRLDIIW